MSKRSPKLKRRICRLANDISKAALLSGDGLAVATIPSHYNSPGRVQGRSDGTIRFLWSNCRDGDWKRLSDAPVKWLRILRRAAWEPNDPVSPLELLARSAC
jgi:hypothetical protein